MDTQSPVLKAVTSNTPIDGLHIQVKNRQNFLPDNKKIIKEPKIVQKMFTMDEIQSKKKKSAET